MQKLKSVLERNIELERQKLYKQQQYQASQSQELLNRFYNEVGSIQKIFEDQNPLYDFYLIAEITDEYSYQIRLCTVRSITVKQPEKETEYYYRGHVVKKSSPEEHKTECISEMHARWIAGQNSWAIIQNNRTGYSEQQYDIIVSRNDLLRDFLNLTVKDIAKLLEDEANSMTY
ncbi:MAG: hypothetical protein ACRBBN_07160 [Methyloligellaceae bacterium]